MFINNELLLITINFVYTYLISLYNTEHSVTDLIKKIKTLYWHKISLELDSYKSFNNFYYVFVWYHIAIFCSDICVCENILDKLVLTFNQTAKLKFVI